MQSERGQALVVLIALLGLAALVFIALGDANDRIVGQVRVLRAAEAAAEAGGAIVSDRLVQLHHAASENGRDDDVVTIALREPELQARAESAAVAVLVPLRAELRRLTLERRGDELSVRAEVLRDGRAAVARVGVKPP